MNVRPTTERCSACGGDGINCSPYALDDEFVPCPLCNGATRRDPIPARGRQGLWNWEPA